MFYTIFCIFLEFSSYHKHFQQRRDNSITCYTALSHSYVPPVLCAGTNDISKSLRSFVTRQASSGIRTTQDDVLDLLLVL